MALLQVFLLLGFALSLVYLQLPVFIWSFSFFVLLFLVTVFGSINSIILVLFWCLFLVVALFANATQFRRKYFIQPLRPILKQRLPTVSATEQEALEAGDVWWEKELFCGRPQWKKLLGLATTPLTDEEQAFLAEQVEVLCSMLDDWTIVAVDHDLPKAVWAYLKKERFFGLVIPKQYGGHGFSAVAHSTIIMKIATRSVSAAVNTMVPNSLGPGELILHYGTDRQKQYYLPRLAYGEDIPCFALTGTEAGSDAGSITDQGIVGFGDYLGKKTLGITLSWDKRYITLAPVATLLGIAFHLYDPDHLLGDKEDIGITLALIPAHHPGVEVGSRHFPGYLAFMNGPTRGNHVFIPLDWIIGGVERRGQGWKMLMESLSIGRGISLPALSTACGHLAYRMTGAYARVRKQFNLPIAYFEGVEEALAGIAGMTYTLEACRMLTAGAVDQKVKPSIASAIAKYHMTEMARKILSHAMDVQAGHAIQAGPRNFILNAYLGIPVSITVEGANILTRNLIIFGQGAIRCHPFVRTEIALLSAEASAENTAKLDAVLFTHISFVLSNVVRNLVCGITGGHLLSSPVTNAASHYYRQLSRMSVALALLADVSMLLLGGDLKRKERTSARLGDMLSELYLASAILKYFHEYGTTAADVDYMQWSVSMCLYRIQVACDELLHNFPLRWLGKIVQWMLFPWGKAYRKPHDDVSHRLVNAMVSPSDLRARLTQHFYLSKNPQDASARLEKAMRIVQQVDPIWKKFQNALRHGTVSKLDDLATQMAVATAKNVLTPAEVVMLADFDALVKEVIRVDEFSFDLKTVIS